MGLRLLSGLRVAAVDSFHVRSDNPDIRLPSLVFRGSPGFT